MYMSKTAATIALVCALIGLSAAVSGLFLVSGAATAIPMMSLPRRASNDLKVLVASPLALLLTLMFAGGTVAALALFPRAVVAAAGDIAAGDTAAGAPAAAAQ